MATRSRSVPARKNVRTRRKSAAAVTSGASGQGAQPPPPDPVAVPQPAQRRLQVFSLDPAADVRLEDSLISRSVIPVRWEKLDAGPIGEYVEVVDVDPASGCVYDPVDLNDGALLAQDGLAPSTGNPQFHQQMVYAVAMKTIANFERVLGRKLLWAERVYDERGEVLRRARARDRYVQRLRIYPHALREENAYYSPAKGALLFGYFNAASADPRDELPGGVVFTCLSHDIIAHEVTHAILDGMHRRMLDTTNPDMIAFHEAFADIVAIFQHFTLPGLLADQIQRTRGNLQSNNLLAQLAAQFARSTGRGDALRNALGSFDRRDRRQPPDPTALSRTFEPHERGAILVAAVFDAFVRMYESRIADLRRIATGGTGVLPAGEIHPDLARRFAEEAVRTAQRVLNMCIRAVDYLPPVDVTFGDFARALVTADIDFYSDDPRRYRLAFIEAFRNHGIYPLDVRTLAEDALRWRPLDPDVRPAIRKILPPPAVLRSMAATYDSDAMSKLFGADGSPAGGIDASGALAKTFAKGQFRSAARQFLEAAWLQEAPPSAERPRVNERFARYLADRRFARFLHSWITGTARHGHLSADEIQQIEWNLGIDLNAVKSDSEDEGRLEVHAVRPTLRLRSDGRSKLELLIVLTQRRRLEVPATDDENSPPLRAPDGTPLTTVFRGGSTIIVDPETGQVTYAIGKLITSEARRARHMNFLRDQVAQNGNTAIARFGLTPETAKQKRQQEPFAIAHTSQPTPAGY
jgi:hypothetical protein